MIETDNTTLEQFYMHLSVSIPVFMEIAIVIDWRGSTIFRLQLIDNKFVNQTHIEATSEWVNHVEELSMKYFNMLASFGQTKSIFWIEGEKW